MAYGDRPFGLRDIKVANIGFTTQVDLPAARMMTFKERLTSGELRGDDSTLAVVAITDAVEWELENGGIPLAAWAIMTGHTAAETGTTPNAVTTYTIEAGQNYPYFRIYGKAVGENATDDTHVLLYKCKCTGAIEGSFQDGEFWITKCSGIAVDDGTNGIADIIQNETAEDLPAPA